MQQAQYHRLYTDVAGASHFETVAVELLPADFSPPTDPLNVAQFRPGAATFWAGAPPEWNGGMPHPSPQRQIFCVLQGEIEVTASDGDSRRLPAGSLLVLEDTWGQGHQTRIVGNEPLLMFGVVLAD